SMFSSSRKNSPIVRFEKSRTYPPPILKIESRNFISVDLKLAMLFLITHLAPSPKSRAKGFCHGGHVFLDTFFLGLKDLDKLLIVVVQIVLKPIPVDQPYSSSVSQFLCGFCVVGIGNHHGLVAPVESLSRNGLLDSGVAY